MHKREKERQAMQRGEQIRGELLTLLARGPQTPADLLDQLDRALDVSRPEVAFQLERLEDEQGAVAHDQDGRYRLT